MKIMNSQVLYMYIYNNEQNTNPKTKFVDPE